MRSAGAVGYWLALVLMGLPDRFRAEGFDFVGGIVDVFDQLDRIEFLMLGVRDRQRRDAGEMVVM
jgi:hypothetical protein